MNLSWRTIVQHALPQAAASEAQALSERRLETRVPSQISVKLRWEDGELVQETAGVAEDVSENGFSILTAEPLEPGRTVWVAGRAVTGRKAIVRYCQASDGGYSLGVRAVNRERRRVDRQPVEGVGLMRFGDTKGNTISAEATVKNISDGGMQLATDIAAPSDTYIRLTGETIACEGTVRYCEKENDSYLLGVQFIREPSIATDTEAEDI